MQQFDSGAIFFPRTAQPQIETQLNNLKVNFERVPDAPFSQGLLYRFSKKDFSKINTIKVDHVFVDTNRVQDIYQRVTGLVNSQQDKINLDLSNLTSKGINNVGGRGVGEAVLFFAAQAVIETAGRPVTTNINFSNNGLKNPNLSMFDKAKSIFINLQTVDLSGNNVTNRPFKADPSIKFIKDGAELGGNSPRNQDSGAPAPSAVNMQRSGQHYNPVQATQLPVREVRFIQRPPPAPLHQLTFLSLNSTFSPS